MARAWKVNPRSEEQKLESWDWADGCIHTVGRSDCDRGVER